MRHSINHPFPMVVWPSYVSFCLPPLPPAHCRAEVAFPAGIYVYGKGTGVLSENSPFWDGP